MLTDRKSFNSWPPVDFNAEAIALIHKRANWQILKEGNCQLFLRKTTAILSRNALSPTRSLLLCFFFLEASLANIPLYSIYLHECYVRGSSTMLRVCSIKNLNQVHISIVLKRMFAFGNLETNLL